MNRKCYPGLWEGVRHKRKQRAIQMSKERKAKEIAKSKTLIAQGGIADGDNFHFICWGDITELELWEFRP